MSRFLVTGCAGFIASHLTARLLGEGHEVVGIDDLNEAYPVTLKDARLAGLRGDFAFIKGGVADGNTLEAIDDPGNIDGVFHLAARAGVRASLDDPFIYEHTNALGTLTVLEWMRRHDVPRMMLASTSSLYAGTEAVPFSEDAHSSRPLSPYAATKKAAETMCASYTHLYGIATPVARFFTVYGPAGRPDMSVLRFIQAVVDDRPLTLYGDGTQRRDFTYVEDIVEGALVVGRQPGHRIVNLGNDQPHTVLELIATIEAAVGRKARVAYEPRHRADMDATWADISVARSMGWAPHTDLAEGIRRTVRWHQANPHLARRALGWI